MKTNITQYQKWGIFVFVIILSIVLIQIQNKSALLYGVLVSFVNLGIYLGFYYKNKDQVPHYQAQALIAVINNTVIRFAVIGVLLAIGLTMTEYNPKTLIFGFVLGQVFFLINQLFMVVSTNGK